MVLGDLAFEVLARFHAMDLPVAVPAVLWQGDGFLESICKQSTLMPKPTDGLVQCVTSVCCHVFMDSHRTVPVAPVAGDKAGPVWIRFPLRCPPQPWARTSYHVSYFPVLVRLRCTCFRSTFLLHVSLRMHHILGSWCSILHKLKGPPRPLVD